MGPVTISKKKAIIRKFMKEMTRYAVSCASHLDIDANEADIKMFVAEKFTPYVGGRTRGRRSR